MCVQSGDGCDTSSVLVGTVKLITIIARIVGGAAKSAATATATAGNEGPAAAAALANIMRQPGLEPEPKP
jgi:hypothetical protein